MSAATARVTPTAVQVGDEPGDASVRPTPSLRILFIGLALYAAFGKGFAYAGRPPVFVGEVLLALVLVSAVRPSAAIPRHPAALVTVVLAGIGVVQFAVDRLVAADPLIETLRGLAPLYYSAYAFGAYALLRAYEQQAGRPAVMGSVERAITRAVPWVLAAVTVLAALLLIEPSGLPTWPGSDVSMLLTKSGDIAVTLVLVAPVLFDHRLGRRLGDHRLLSIGLWCATALLVISRSRGALLALVAGLLVARPHPVRMVKGVMAATSVVVLLYVTGLSVEVSNRELSYDALGDAVQSTLGAASEEEIGSNYLGTTQWRADWWGAIWADVEQHAMLLHGHGWGDNLAVRYGVTDVPDEFTALRLPHNVFFSLAGRAGLVVAIGLVVVVPLLTIVPTFTRLAARPAPAIVQAARGGVAAALVTGLTDIYVESPQGGILFWSLIGFLWFACAPPVEGDAEGRLVPRGREPASPERLPRRPLGGTHRR
ncbi:MAG TPA: O-antigen ligase family protein [Acidimicrobiales bacterium]